MPAAVKVFQVPQFNAPVSQKTFFKGDKVQLKWNDLGTSLIVLAQTEVDKTNKSYYGETNMYILSANGSFDSRVQLGTFFGLVHWIHTNFRQIRRDLSTTWPGRQTRKSSVLFTVTCPPKPLSLTLAQYPSMIST